MKQLVTLLAGDPAPTHRAALLRQPETENTKEPPPRRCHAVWQGGKECDVSEFADMLDMYGDRPLLTRKEEPGSNGSDPSPDPPAKERLDVAARLGAMRHKGPGDSSIHRTQLQVSASLLRSGIPVEDAVPQILEATRHAVAGDAHAASWKWDKERWKIERLCYDHVSKNPELAGTLPNKLYAAWMDRLSAGRTDPKVTYSPHIGWHVRSADKAKTGNKTASTNPGRPETEAEPDTETPRDGAGSASRRFVIRPFVPFDLAALPPRQWLYGRHYQRCTVSATIAPGGFGKTTLCMVETVAMATCRNLLGEQPTERLRAWYHNGEDTLEELQRRLGAICLHYEIPQEELRGWFFMTSGNEVPLRVAAGYSDLKIDKPLVELINAEIARNEVDVAVLDPLITLHGVPEQDNSKMDTVIRIFAGIADTQNCAVELAHHTRKLPPGANGTDYVAADIRGATATKDAVRAARMLNHMGEKDAEAAGIPEHERTAYFRVDRVKGNNSPAAKAVWRRFVNVELPNSDEVGVVVAWEFPGQGSPSAEMRKAEHDAEMVFLRLLGRLALEGRVASDRVGPNYAPALFSREDEAKDAKISKVALAAAMRRLFAARRIRVDTEGKGGHRVHRIVTV